MNLQKVLTVGVIAIPFAIGALALYKNFNAELTPGDGDLIVNVNTATQSELATIPGIGPSLAHEIIRERPYARVEDLERVRGIGSYTLNSIRPYVKVDGQTSKR